MRVGRQRRHRAVRIPMRVGAALTLVVLSVGPVTPADGSPSSRNGPRAAGSQAWARLFDAGPEDHAWDVAASPDGSRVFVTGLSTGANGWDVLTVAYDAATGTRRWVRRYNGPANGNDMGSSIIVSPDGSAVFVTGRSRGTAATFEDYITIAYGAASGAQRWTRRFNGPAGSYDNAVAIGVSPSGSTVFVTGTSVSVATGDDFLTVAYRATNGSEMWRSRYHAPGDDYNQPLALAVSPNGARVFVTGYGYDFVTVALNASSGARAWVRRYDGPAGDDDIAHAIGVSPDGSKVFVTGSSDGSSKDYATVAYRTSTGAQLWVRRYDGPADSLDSAQALAVGPDGTKVFVTGSSLSVTSDDYLTIAYDAATGARSWVQRYGSPGGDWDYPVALGVSPDGSTLVVTGTSESESVQRDYITVAYGASAGVRRWTARFASPSGKSDAASGLAVTADGSKVVVTGSSYDNTDPFEIHSGDYATVAYSLR